MKQYPKFKAAAAHLAPVFLDTEATVDKACSVISEAARAGAAIVVFPESYIPGFPVWSGVVAPICTHDHFKKLAATAIDVNGPELAKIRTAAKRHGVVVSIGFTESTTASVGCLWNSNVLIDVDGKILNHHRKLVPTFYEKLVWANGDGAGLRVSDTSVGRIGALICGENTNPLARYALMAQGEQVHISTYAPIYPTRPVGGGANYNFEQAIRIRAGAHSFEAKAFNIVASSHYDESTRSAIEDLGREALETLDACPRAVSMIIDPSGNVISDVCTNAEGVVYADIDIEACVEPKRIHDVVGYYNRFDIFKLIVDRTANRPIVFDDFSETSARTSPMGTAEFRRKLDGPTTEYNAPDTLLDMQSFEP